MYNPIRRNRKIGKTQGGRVQNGRAEEKFSRWLQLSTWKKLSADDLPKWHVIRENPSRDYFHPCNAEEIHAALRRLPEDLSKTVRSIVLARPRKHDIANEVEARRHFKCIVLVAFPKHREMLWSSRPSDAVRRHYEPWCSNWSDSPSDGWKLSWTDGQLKRYYLYHLLLHELGHIVEPMGRSARRDEHFAENFALEWARTLGELAP